MDKEIEKLKKIYLETGIPKDFQANGFEDILLRRRKYREIHNSYVLRFAILTVLLLVTITGFACLTLYAKPHTAFYSVKVATQKAVFDTLHLTPQKVETNLKKIIQMKKVSPTPTISPTATPVKSNVDENSSFEKNENNKTESGEREGNSQGNSGEVKGMSTIKPTLQNNQNNHQQDQDHNNSQNAQENENHGNSSSHNNKK